jgi:predicted ATPase/predicted metal-dependent phosphoesterase TrpH
MAMANGTYPRGSEWRQWDLHVHSPASFHWLGAKFTHKGIGESDLPLVDEMIAAFNAAPPAAFALMDYWHFDGWFALKNRLAQANAPALIKTVFPGIQLRLCAPMKSRLNAHVIFSNEIRDQQLHDFRSQLRLELIDVPLSEDGLIQYARRVGEDLLFKHGFKKSDVDAADAVALLAGCKVAELNCESYKKAIKAVPDGLAIGFMPFNTSDGLSKIDQMNHYAYALGLFKSSPIFEARDDATWNAFVGRKTDDNKDWFDSFQEALDKKSRLPVSGSDAHQFKGVAGDNNQRGYGDFPSGRLTWIKADPTWLGLLQAIKDPEKRCHIGLQPAKMATVAANKTFYIDKIALAKVPESALADKWFDGCSLPLNPDLVAIIGNKGSGKSALTDAIALLGSSQQTKHFSFLKTGRFRGKAGEPARQFTGQIDWLAGVPRFANLADDPTADKVELVRYIPQGRFEVLCNDHVSGKSDGFERELRAVIFSHIESTERLDALDFDQLIEAQEKHFRARLDELRKNLGTLNRTITSIEDQLHPDVRKNLEEQLGLKAGEIAELEAAQPKDVLQPSEALTPDQEAAGAKLTELTKQQADLAVQSKALSDALSGIAGKKQASKNVEERLRLFDSQVGKLKADLAADLEKIGLPFESLVSINIDRVALETLVAANAAEADRISHEIAQCAASQRQAKADAQSLSDALNEPQRAYQAYVAALKAWKDQIDVLAGAADKPDSREGLKARLAQIDKLPEQLEQRILERDRLTAEIYDVLAEQREARAALFKPLQDLIEGNDLVRDHYKLQFRANLSLSTEALAENIFSIVKQNVGSLRGEDDSRAALKERCDRHDLNARDGASGLANDLMALLNDAARKSEPNNHGVRAICRKDRQPSEVYDYIFGLDYIQTKYTLLFQDSTIEQLSPGQRGALLLIFYLLIDNRRNPIILDQPEENLDNETIFTLLVPVISEAKKSRQIIMVTHNPNLAVVCDAEQVICAEFDRGNNSTISYLSGAIESPHINERIVVVLEGTMPAFNNRREAYHQKRG